MRLCYDGYIYEKRTLCGPEGQKAWEEVRNRMEHTIAQNKAPCFGGRAPLFSQRDLLRLVGPLLVEQLLAVTVGMADTMMVSRCGEAAISGVSLVDMINNLIIVLFAALATGGAVVVSQYLGAKEQKHANASSGQLILLSALLGVGVGVFCFVLARPMIRLCYGSIDTDVLEAGVLYLRITAVSYPFLAMYNAGAALFRSMGNSKISMQISILMNIINIVGNAVCIFVLGMGVDGVAWPSVLSRAVAAVLILNRCYQKGHMLTVPKTFRLDGRMAKRIPGKAISLAMITVVGRCVGAGDNEQTVFYTRKLLLWAYISMGIFNGGILLFLKPLVGIYALSGETMALAILLVQIHAGSGLFLWPASFVLPNALRAANDVKFTMVVSVLSMAVWRLGFSYLLCVRMGWGAVGVWIAMVIDWVCRVICFVARMKSGAWKTKYQA